MNRNVKNIVSMLLVFVLVAGIFAALPLAASATPTPVAGQPAWDNKYSAVAEGNQRTGEYYDRGNASGDKISSNAHSGDYPGVYFRWDDKQKLPGVFLVEGWVFDLFVDGVFYLTAKNSNSYYKYEISKDTGELKDGVYVYGIPKEVMGKDNKGNNVKDELKNINMVFIDGTYKSASFEIVKNWYDEEGTPIEGTGLVATFNNGYKVGTNVVSFSTYPDAVKGKSITVTENAIAGFSLDKIELNGEPVAKATFNVAPGDVSNVVTFHNQKQWAYIQIVKIWLDVDGNEITNLGRVAELNAQFEIDGEPVTGLITLLGSSQVFAPYKVKEGAYRVAETGCTAGFSIVGDDKVDVTVAAGKTVQVTFYNQEQKSPFDVEVSVMKTVEGTIISEWWTSAELEGDIADYLSFQLWKVNEKGDAIATGTLICNGDTTDLLTTGVIDFGKVSEKGWYAVVEVLTLEGAKIFEQAEPMYIYVGESGYSSAGIQVVSGNAYGALVEADMGVNGQVWNLPQVWNEGLTTAGYGDELNTMLDLNAEWIWANTNTGYVNTYVYGVDGSEAKFEINIGVSKDITVPFYFACDNVAVVYLNGELAGYTEIPFDGRTLPDNSYDVTAQTFFNNLDFSTFDGRWNEGWTHAYCIDLDLVEGENVITIYAANSARTEGTGTDNDGYNTTNNPCGIIFACEVPGDAFENTLAVPKSATITIIKNWVDETGLLAEDAESYDGATAKFLINGDEYTYGDIVEVEAGEIEIAELYIDLWHLDSVTVDGTDVDIITSTDPWGFEMMYVEFSVEAGKNYEFIFTNQKNVVPLSEYYMNFVSGTDFGVAVVDSGQRWIDNAWNDFSLANCEDPDNPTISDYWNYWVDAYGSGAIGVAEMKAIAGNPLDPKYMTWVWTRGVTMVPECQVGGDEFTVTFEETFFIEGNEITAVSSLYFLADNAVAVYIDGQFVGLTTEAWIGDNYLNDAGNEANWKNLHDFRLYKADLSAFITETGWHTIKIIATNEPVTVMEWNPCGVLLAFEVYSSD